MTDPYSDAAIGGLGSGPRYPIDDERCPSLYGPEQIQCTKRAGEPHEWHSGSGFYPDDEPFGTPGEVYGAAWLSHWEPGLTDREATP